MSERSSHHAIAARSLEAPAVTEGPAVPVVAVTSAPPVLPQGALLSRLVPVAT
jgi:hypothetical protein